MHGLLALCLRFSPRPNPDTLRTAAAQIEDWESIPALVEMHGLAPLLNYQLVNAGVQLPPDTALTLKGQALRDRLENKARSRQIATLATEFANAGLTLVFLKGSALAHLLYPEAGLRPMSDIDVLVKSDDLPAAVDLLNRLGFSHAPLNLDDLDKRRHLPVFIKEDDGYVIQLELHFAMLQRNDGQPWFRLEDLLSPLQTFSPVPGVSALALGHEDMLFHLCQHTLYNNRGFEALRWGKLADILNYAEIFNAQINWELVCRRYPCVPHVLSCLHELAPLSTNLPEKTRQALPPMRPARVGEGFNGWPVVTIQSRHKSGLRSFLNNTLFPSPWWLELEYGIDHPAPLWYYWLKHLYNLLGEAQMRIRLRLSQK